MANLLESGSRKEEGRPTVEAVMPLNTFANICGFFYNACLAEGCEDKPVVNNGYNCKHPDVGDEDEGIGYCLVSACPLAYPADGLTRCEQCQNCEECGNEGCECDDDLVVATIPQDEFDARHMELVQPEPGTPVSFVDAVVGSKGREPSKVWVRFSYHNVDGQRVHQKDIRLSILYKDWYGECEHCPSNDTKITELHIRTADGAKFSVADAGLEFGDFMDTLEANFKFQRPKTD